MVILFQMPKKLSRDMEDINKNQTSSNKNCIEMKNTRDGINGILHVTEEDLVNSRA